MKCVVYCDEKGCYKTNQMDTETTENINWRCEEHKIPSENEKEI